MRQAPLPMPSSTSSHSANSPQAVSPNLSAPPLDFGTQLRQRVLMGVILVTVGWGVIWAGSWWFTLALFAVFYQGFKELYAIFKAKDIYPSKTSVFIVGSTLLVLAQLKLTEFIMPCVALGIIVSFIHLLFRQHKVATINDMGGTFTAIFYLGFLPIFFILLRNLKPDVPLNLPFEPGVYYVFFTTLVISASDIGAYFVGKSFGKHLLYEQVSPKKTREGAFGGLFLGCLAGLGFMLTGQFSLIHALILSALIILVSQLGDLTESLIKRDAGIKDSGTSLMGHGGFLDRFDSYFFCGVLAYYYIHWFILHQGLAQEVIEFF